MDLTNISKLEIAKIAIEAAIEMHSLGRYVPAVLLSGASGRISDDLCRKMKIQTALDRVAAPNANSSSEEIRSKFEEVYNSAKHADREPLGTLDFSESESLMLIKRALIDLKSLGVSSISGVDRIT